VFPITGEPIPAVRGAGGYRTLFHINLDRRDGFPIQPGSWDECYFIELRDGRIAITVKAREVFAVWSRSDDTAVEAAQRQSDHTEIYDLRTLGLADQAGRPTAEGRTLLEFLRNGGKLTRRGDDTGILRLAQRLRGWMGLHGDPFQFTPTRTLWSTFFESSRD